MCEHDLVKVAVRGHVGVHGGLSHCSRPQELSSVFVIHDTVTTTHWARNQWTLSASLSPLSSVQELQVVSGVCSMLEAVRSADRRGGL